MRREGHKTSAGGKGDVHTRFWWEKLTEKDLGIGYSIILKRIFDKYFGGAVWFIFLRITTGGGLVRTQ